MITDAKSAGGRPLEGIVAAAIEGGAGVVQLRDKELSDADLVDLAIRLLAVTRPKNVPLIINDRIEVAQISGADGVHLGQDDRSLGEARGMLGDGLIVGRSTHSPNQVMSAVKEGFDYIGVGPVFGTPTKPDYVPVGLELVRYAAANVHIPFVAIGGIDTTNVATVRQAGAKTVAVVRAVMAAIDPKSVAEQLSKTK